MHDEPQSLGEELQEIVIKTLWSAFTGIAIGLAMGIFNQVLRSAHIILHLLISMMFTIRTRSALL